MASAEVANGILKSDPVKPVPAGDPGVTTSSTSTSSFSSSGFTTDPAPSGFISGPYEPIARGQPVPPKKSVTPSKPVLCLTTRMTELLKTVFLRTPDRFLLHLNRLFAPAEDVAAVVSTMYYLIRLLRRFRPKRVLNLETMPTFTTAVISDEATSRSNWISGSGNLFWKARMTLRLFRGLSIYAEGRRLMTEPVPENDKALYGIKLLQCALNGGSQLLENVAFLTERKIAPGSLSNSLTKVQQGRSRAVYTLAYRMWFLAASCEILAMIRRIHLMGQHAAEARLAEKSGTPVVHKNHPWWHLEFLLPMAWFPLGWQFSDWTEKGSPGFNTALHDAACVLSDIEKTGTLWRGGPPVLATKPAPLPKK